MDYVKIANNSFPVIMAITSSEQERGLMFQPWPPPAMAFFYAEPRINQFWMKDTISALDIIFCLKNKIVAIRSGEPNSLRVIGSDVISDLVVEFPAGICANYSLVEGMHISLELDDSSKMKIFAANTLHGW